MAEMRIAVVGPTGVVGREVLGALRVEGVDSERVTALGSERSAGQEVDYGEDSLEVEKLDADSFRGIALAIFATPADASQKLVPMAQAAGAAVVDASSAFRFDPNGMLVLPGVTPPGVPAGKRLLATPGSVASAVMTVLQPLRAPFGIAELNVHALMSVSSLGMRGVSQLEKETSALMAGREGEEGPFPHRVGFNVVPQVGEFLPGKDLTVDEAQFKVETARLWGASSPAELPRMEITSTWIPTFYGMCFHLQARLRKQATADDVRSALKLSERVKVLDQPGEKIYPMPMLVTGDSAVHVGRIRVSHDVVTLFGVADNAGRAAATLVETAGRFVSLGGA